MYNTKTKEVSTNAFILYQMKSEKPAFEVLVLFEKPTRNRYEMLVKRINEVDFSLTDSSQLGGFVIKSFSTARVIDNQGQSRTDLIHVVLKNKAETVQFKKGQILQLDP